VLWGTGTPPEELRLREENLQAEPQMLLRLSVCAYLFIFLLLKRTFYYRNTQITELPSRDFREGVVSLCVFPSG